MIAFLDVKYSEEPCTARSAIVLATNWIDSAAAWQTVVDVVDGYVWLDRNGRPGLGAKLFDSLDKAIPVVGAARTRFHNAPGTEILRRHSRKPLIVTTAGCDEREASELVRTMHGEFRIPTLLKLVDQLARGNQ